MKKTIQHIVFSGTNITLISVMSLFLKTPLANAQKFAKGIVFDPPSNVRVKPNTNSRVLCRITSVKTIDIYPEGKWYHTYTCGHHQEGYIHISQVRLIKSSIPSGAPQ